MGFGLLLLGYALSFAFTLSPDYFFADVLGGLIMTYACSKLCAYQKHFKYPLIFSSIFTLIAIIRAISRFIISFSSSVFEHYLDAVYAGNVILFHFSLFFAIIAITRDLKLTKITMKARRNMIFMIIYYTLHSLVILSNNWIIENAGQYASYISGFILIYQLVWMFLNILLIGSCLKWIGEEGEDAPDPNPSKIKKLYKAWSDKEDKIFNKKYKNQKNIEKNRTITKGKGR